MKWLNTITTIGLAVVIQATVALPAFAQKLEEVKARDVLRCGISAGKTGFAVPDTQGRWTGFDVDFCRAVAAAVLGDGDKVEFITLSAKNRFTALTSDEVDLLSRSTTATATRDGANGVDFGGVWFYDGQAFLVKTALGASTGADLEGATVCTFPGTTSEKNINDFFSGRGLEYQALIIEAADEAEAAYLEDRCDVMSNDFTGLASTRLGFHDPNLHVVLPELISKEPLGPFVKQGDAVWLDVVKWTRMALIAAEEMGVTQANVAEMGADGSPEVKRLLGTEENIGKNFGLETNWAANVISSVGNYGEIFDRNLGAASPMKIERGLNALWTEGGLQYAYPFR